MLFYKFIGKLSISEFQGGDSDLCCKKFREIVFVFKADGIGKFLHRHIGFKEEALPLGKALAEYILLRAYIKDTLEIVGEIHSADIHKLGKIGERYILSKVVIDVGEHRLEAGDNIAFKRHFAGEV